jgi:ATP-binding cassette subfamily B protein
LWRLAGWIASSVFIGVTGDVRRDLFRHLTGHALSYFADRMPGTLTSRVTATSNAVYTLENMFVWNVLPPCVATFVAIIFVVTVSVPMAATDGSRRHPGIDHVTSCRRRAAPAS